MIKWYLKGYFRVMGRIGYWSGRRHMKRALRRKRSY